MKGHYEFMADGQRVDVPPCRTCKHKNKMPVEAPRYWVCSECGYAITGAQTTKPDKLPYCPLCGAKMDKEVQP